MWFPLSIREPHSIYSTVKVWDCPFDPQAVKAKPERPADDVVSNKPRRLYVMGSFQRFGFDKNRLFYMQGDYGLWQCSEPCHNKTYDNEAIVRRMYSEQEWMKVPKELIPYCPICGRPMEMNLRCDDRFVQDEGWYESARRFEAYMQECYHEDTLFLELGVGFNTPSLIKYPFWKDAAMNQRHRYICINTDFPVYPKELTGRALAIKADIGTVLKDILDQSEAESGV